MTKSKKRQRSQLAINCINEQLKNEFVQYSFEHQITYHNLLSLIWDNFKYSHIDFTPSEKALIDEAVQISGNSLENIKKQAILKSVKKIIINKEKLIDNKHLKGADLRIDDIVKEMMLRNDQVNEWYHRKFITQKSIEEYSKKEKGRSINMAVIKRYIKNNKDIIEQHHAKYDMQEDHNSKASRHKRMLDYKTKDN